MRAELAAIEWKNLPAISDYEERHAVDHAICLARDWLEEFGIGIFEGDDPDAYARLDGDRFAFLLTSGDRNVAVIVSVEYDADGTPGGGWRDCSSATRVDVCRV